MTKADRGSICKVPKVGPEALVLVLSSVRGVGRGRPEFQVVPLRMPGLLTQHTASDYLLKPSETTLGVGYFAALWNARPLLQRDLGEVVGEVTSRDVLHGLRDAYLRMADPSIQVGMGRLGSESLSEVAEALRSQELAAWEPLTGRVLESVVDSEEHVEFAFALNSWRQFSEVELQKLNAVVHRGEALSNPACHVIVGADTVLFGMPSQPPLDPTFPMHQLLSCRAGTEFSTGASMPVPLDARMMKVTGEFAGISRVGNVT